MNRIDVGVRGGFDGWVRIWMRDVRPISISRPVTIMYFFLSLLFVLCGKQITLEALEAVLSHSRDWYYEFS